jgi:phospholipid/cholesterol/gamma-HCH transport system substrate-binding protein
MNSRYIRVAVFFIALGIAGSVYIIASANGLNDFTAQTYDALLSDATGLSTRSKIYLAGVAVGQVRSISLENNAARLRVSFPRELEIREDARIIRRASSILGTSALYLEPGTELSPVIPPGGFIHSGKTSGDMAAVLATFHSIAEKIDARSDAEIERISRILESIAQITGRLESLLFAGGETDTERGAVYAALENIRIITDDIRRGEGNIGRALYDDQLYTSLLAAVQRIENSAGRVQETLDNINVLAKDADGVVADAGIIVKKAVGLGVEVDTFGRYDVIAEQVRANASLRLVPASKDRWYRVGVSSAPDGVASRRIKEVSGSGAQTVEEITETRYSSFTVDAEMARSFGFLTLHGGLLENTAGIGIDIQPVRWVGLSGEVFNFRRDGRPNLRGTLTLYPFFDPESTKPWNWLYLRGGVNDALNDQRDYFVGAGLRLSDSEIKGMVGLIPALNN